MRQRSVSFVGLLILLAGCSPLSVLGATLTVTNTDDSGAGSLRDAIADAHPGDTINFSVTGTIILNSTLSITRDLTIAGPGASSLAISGNNLVRVFYVSSGQVNISGLTIEDGNVSSLGGGIFNAGTLALTSSAILHNTGNVGGIWNDGTLTLTSSTVSNNTGVAGGIYNEGIATLTNSTVSGNSAPATGCSAGICNYGGTLTLTNSTVSGNSAPSGGVNGGIFNFGTLTLTNSTVSGNSGSVGGIYNDFGTLTLTNSTISGNTGLTGGIFSYNSSLALKNTVMARGASGGNCTVSAGAATSEGHNLSDDTSCVSFLTAAGDLNNTPAGLDPNGLQDNGGPTLTIALLPTSPAVDAIPVSPTNYCTAIDGTTPLATDQRGIARPQGARCDIGAFEGQSDSTPPAIVSHVSGTLGNNGWYRSAVAISWDVSDPESGIASSSSCGTTSLMADTSSVTLTCSATNGVGLSSSASVTVKIDKTPPSITASRVPAPNLAGWNNTDVTVSFACADGMSGVSNVSPVSALLSAEGANQAVAGSCADNAGNSATAAMGGINIDKTAPTSTNVAATPDPVAINSAVTLSANLSDLGGSNLAGAEYSVNGSAPSVLGTASGPSAQVSGTLPTFAATGVYNVCVHAQDVAGNVGADECFFLPVYDPTGGFVTGGGWINSPLGAYSPDPSLVGKATFGFESRYQNGANVPTGDTQFQFRAASLNFKSISYEWLVIGGARAQYKGVGTINGVGSYGFLLTAIDGDKAGGDGVDRFRIKIWSATGVIYDNQPGSTDNDDPTTALGGGSIVIHNN